MATMLIVTRSVRLQGPHFWSRYIESYAFRQYGSTRWLNVSISTLRAYACMIAASVSILASYCWERGDSDPAMQPYTELYGHKLRKGKCHLSTGCSPHYDWVVQRTCGQLLPIRCPSNVYHIVAAHSDLSSRYCVPRTASGDHQQQASSKSWH